MGDRLRADPARPDPTVDETPRSLDQRERERLREDANGAIGTKVINPDGTLVGEEAVEILSRIADDIHAVRELLEKKS